MKNFIKIIIIFICSIILFCVTLTLTSLIPNRYIKNNVKDSSLILFYENNFPQVEVKSKDVDLIFDNMTDALMINTAYSIDNNKPFYSSMIARKNYNPKLTKVVHPEKKGLILSDSKFKRLNQIKELSDFVDEKRLDSFEYARYWHGYLIFLRPLLLIFNIYQIRLLFKFIFYILGIVWIYLLYKKIDLYTAIIYMMGFIITDYFLVYNSIQVIPVFLISSIASIIILKYRVKNKKIFFLIIGLLTNFFDFLTVPLITVMMPLLSYFLIEKKNNNYNKKEIITNTLLYFLYWGIGYGVIWFLKWVLVDIIYHKNIIKISFQQILYRTGGNELKTGVYKKIYASKVSKIYALIRNFYVVKIPFAVFIIVNFIYLCIKKKKDNIKLILIKKNKFLYTYLYLFVAVMGIIWYMVLAQHSCCHPHFTYRNFWFISVSILLLEKELFSIKYNKKVKK